METKEKRIVVYDAVIDSYIEEIEKSIPQRERMFKITDENYNNFTYYKYGFGMCHRLTFFGKKLFGHCVLNDFVEFCILREFYGLSFDVEDFDSRFEFLDKCIKL